MARTPSALDGVVPALATEEEQQRIEAEALKKFVDERDRMNLPGVYVDKVHITYWKDHVRLNMGESAPRRKNGTFWRFAAIMEKEDLKYLIRRLQNVMKDLENYDDQDDPSTDEE